LATVNKVGKAKPELDQVVVADRYRLLRRLATGASGEVFLAADGNREGRVVVKVLPARASSRALRFEFARLTELSHPNIVRVQDAGMYLDATGESRAFLVMEHVGGRSLAEVIASRSGASRVETFAAAAESLADALAYLHGRGVSHGDISPANVRCTEADAPILIDFGLSLLGATVPSTEATASGTLGFAAPEALVGERGPSGDLFALGATLYHAWTGTPPFGVGLEAVARMWQLSPPAPSTLRPGLPEAWDALLLRTLAPTIEGRPASARELLQAIRTAKPGQPIPIECELAVPYPAGDPLAGAFVGRADEEDRLRGYLERLAEGAADVSVVWVSGPVGAGRRTLIRRATRDARLAMLAQTMPSFDIDETSCASLLEREQAASSSSSAEPLRWSQAEIARLVGELEARAAAKPLCLVLPGAAEDQALAEALTLGQASGRLLILLPCEQPKVRSGSAVIALPSLSRAAVIELARRSAGVEPAVEIVDKIWSASLGLAGAVAVLVRRWIANVRDGKPAALDSADSAQDLGSLLDKGFASLGRSVQAFLVAVALDEDAEGDRSGLEEQSARAAGWLVPSGRELPSPLHVAALWRALSSEPSLRAIAERAASRLPREDLRLAEVQLALGRRREAAENFWAAMRSAQRSNAWGSVGQLGLRAVEADRESGSCEDRLALAGALGVLGRYGEGMAILDGCRAPSNSQWVVSLVERRAWLLGRQGKPTEALTMVEAALRQLPTDSEGALVLRGRLSRLMISCGRFAEAFATAEPVIDSSGSAGHAVREAAVLALAYGGRLREARQLVDSLVPQDGGDGMGPLSARTASLDGLVYQLAGQPLPASKAYRASVEAYEQIQDLHGAAAATFNLGCMLAELGDYGAAIEALERAIRDLGRLRATTDHALAVFNVAQLFLQLGELSAASRAIARLADDVAQSGVDSFRGYVTLLSADLARRRRSFRDAAEAFGEACEALARMGMRSMAAMAELQRAEVLAEQGQLAEARKTLDAHELRVAAVEPDSSVVEASLIARARLVLCDREATTVAILGVAETLSSASDKAKQLGRLPAAWRLASLAFQLFVRARDERQALHRETASSLFSEVAMKTPAKFWPAMQADPDVRGLDLRPETGKAGAEMATHVALLEGRLRRLLRINKRLNSDLRLSRVLETIIDTVIELTDAERGFLLLKDNSGELVVKVARNIEQTSLEGPGLSLSRSIAKQAAETGQPVVTVDAADDRRFSELLSVSDLHLRSVLAVPLAVKGNVVGTIYVDHRLRKGVFGDDELALVLDFAEQGAIAIENARVVSELRRREQQVQSLNRRLEHELKVKEAALDDVRVELKESRQVAALRYDYRQIVGQSPGMLEVFRLLDRVTDTNLPVVVEGESGTGKELVARAIHFHGPRKDRAFVSENCAAVPETLLESTLFGHVRGAFTGADRDSRGLFAVANGGTLFLDEVAEMSPAMQGKLLRVLQDGEYRRVGSERSEKADVRVVVATNKNLAQMVEDGKFRKDLFYRLSVVRIHLPPLRERREDIPLLLRHFLDKAAPSSGATPKGIESAAIDRLCSYAWPGNVRELENEIARAGAFASGTICVADLSPHIQSGQDAVETVRSDGDNLRVRQRVERLERQLIREAMSRSQGNQTKAASLLGLSRFGLQKKLRRYSLNA
jgi:transcriptional regulator with GAF, ATPase, and Fis domain/tetratricopeptide (TPR) repeat protein